LLHPYIQSKYDISEPDNSVVWHACFLFGRFHIQISGLRPAIMIDTFIVLFISSREVLGLVPKILRLVAYIGSVQSIAKYV